jgi:zinc transporter, ZIP family
MEFAEVLALSAIMGLSIFASFPIVMRKNNNERSLALLLAVAIGILIFLMGDVFSDAAASLYNGSLLGYGSSPGNDAAFAAGFFILYLAGSKKKGLSPTELALIIAIGMGFQNLTEGLVFGSLGVTLGLSRAALVVLVGFIFQNLTEGFPIASPFLGKTQGKTLLIVPFFLIGGVPTIIGGAVGFYYNSVMLDLVFDGVAIGAILYAILPMLKTVFRDSASEMHRLSYLGVFIGFLLGFLVNLV